VRALLRPDAEVQRLERDRVAAVENLEQLKNSRCDCDLPDVLVEDPCILHPRFVGVIRRRRRLEAVEEPRNGCFDRG
jgi:hypothetical protein